MSHPFYDLGARCADMVLCAVDKMSVAKVALIGSAGSTVSMASATEAPELAVVDAYLKTATVAVGLAVGLGTLVVVALKAWLIWRHRNSPPKF